VGSPGIKANAKVPDLQYDRAAGLGQFNKSILRMTVLDHIIQGFLRDSEKT